MNEFKKFLFCFLPLLVICLLTVHLLTENDKKILKIQDKWAVAYCDYYIYCTNLHKQYTVMGISEGKYIPDTVKIKHELDSCICMVVAKSFDPIVSEYGENNVKRAIKKFSSKNQFYRKLTNDGVEKVMEAIRVQINVRKTLHPTEEDKMEVLKECGLMQE